MLIILSGLLASCMGPGVRLETANRLAASAGFDKEIIQTSSFKLFVYTRYSGTVDSLTVYIEGDGLAFINKNRVSTNPTPSFPVSLMLASMDKAENIIYIARPCQYIPIESDPFCNAEYWTNKRYSVEVIESINQVIDAQINDREIRFVRLVGYSGGATIATILAATREDVQDLRTIAGNLDIDAFTNYHKVTPLSGSLNPIAFADKLVEIPQIHLVGEDDTIIVRDIIHSYSHSLQKFDPELHCISIESIPGVAHEGDWRTSWRRYSNEYAQCSP